MAHKSLIKDVARKVMEDMEKKKEEFEPVETPLYTPTPEDEELIKILQGLKTNIKIVGCGGAGSNTINRLVEEGVYGADLYAINTDAQHLLTINAPHKILIGRRTTRGLGAGANPRIGRDAAEENREEITQALAGADMVFVTAGMGGGTGTGAAPVIAEIAKQQGALVIAIVTKPFSAEGLARMENAEWGIQELEQFADTVIVIPNDKLLEIVPRLPLNAAFKVADEILMRAIKGIVEMITKVGLVNLDFADLKSIMKGGGVAMIGIGESDEGSDKAQRAVEEALRSPLLEYDISTATGALVCVTGGESMTVAEAEAVAEYVHSKIQKNASIIWGAYIEPELGDTIRVMIVVVGVSSKLISGRSKARMRPGTMEGRLGIDFIR